ncbi:putative integral membrane protein [Cryptosporidium felis]|nr:putative integral membrane protein [Cryptosporidium felis]
MKRFYATLNSYFNCSELSHYRNMFDEEGITKSILKCVPLFIIYLDIIVMGFESFVFTNLLNSGLSEMKKGPGEQEKLHFRDLTKLCRVGLVISLIYLTFLSISDVIMDIFYCHELKRVVREGSTSLNSERYIRDDRNLNVSLLIMENRRNIGSQSGLQSDSDSTEQLILENTVNPIRVSWLKYIISDYSIIKYVHFVNLSDEDDFSEVNIRNELLFSIQNTDSSISRNIVVPRMLPIKVDQKTAYANYQVALIYSTLFTIYQLLDIFNKLTLVYLITQISYWPWNLLISVTMQLIVMGLTLSFHNPPMTNLIIGFAVNLFGPLPLLLSSQNRVKHSVSISCSLLSLRSMEFLFSIILLIIVPFNLSAEDQQWIQSKNTNFNFSTQFNVCKNLIREHAMKDNIINDMEDLFNIKVGELFWLIVVVFFVREALLFVIQKFISTPSNGQGVRHLSLDYTNYDHGSIDFVPYFRFI